MEDTTKVKEDFSKHPWVLKLMTDQKRRRRDLNQILEDVTLTQQIENIKSISKKHERISRQLESELEENKNLTMKATKMEVDFERLRWALEEGNARSESLKKELSFNKEQLDTETKKIMAEAQRKISRYKTEFYRMQDEYERKRESLRKSANECQNAKKKYEALLNASTLNQSELSNIEHEAAHLQLLLNDSNNLLASNGNDCMKDTSMNMQNNEIEPRKLLTEINTEMETLIRQWKSEKSIKK